MPWQLSTPAPKEATDELEALLELVGATSVTTLPADNAPDIVEPKPGDISRWSLNHVVALFPDEIAIDAVVATLQRAWAAGGATREQLVVSVEALDDQDWRNRWKQYVEPRQFGRLWVIADEAPAAMPVDAPCIRLAPGLAFGTGSHPTTALCLHWLADWFGSDATSAGSTIVDYGAGSGILALAAAKLGAKRVHAVDYDPQALTATRANALANGVADQILVSDPDAFAARAEAGPADVVVANILAGPLEALADTLTDLLRPGGHLVLSGLLAEQGEQVMMAYPQIRFDPAVRRGDWLLLSGCRI